MEKDRDRAVFKAGSGVRADMAKAYDRGSDEPEPPKAEPSAPKVVGRGANRRTRGPDPRLSTGQRIFRVLRHG